MNPTILVDTFEPNDMAPLLEQWSLQTVKVNMVPMGLADYSWQGYGSVRYTLERKQGRELVGAMGGRLDEQLRKHLANADVVCLGIQGIITPKLNGGCEFWDQASNGKVFYKRASSPIGYETLQAYLWSLSQQGVVVFQWPDLASMAMGLASFVHNSMKPEHATLNRHIKHRPNLFTPNPYIETLMGIGGDTKIGEKLATRIVEEVGTPFSFFNSEIERWPSIIGEQTYRRAMKNIGRAGF
jgi:hypothetical protein